MQIKFRVLINMSVCLSFLWAASAEAATVINLAHQNVSFLKTLAPKSLAATVQGSSLKQTARHTGKNGLLHVRFTQQYQGVSVLGADGVMHVPQAGNASFQTVLFSAAKTTTLNGRVYQNLEADLPLGVKVFNAGNEAKAVAAAIANYEANVGKQVIITHKKAEPVVFVEPVTQKAHYAYQVTFFADSPRLSDLPARMNVVVDAENFTVYRAINLMMTLASPSVVLAGGYGGNEKMGQLNYDGLEESLHYRSLSVMRDAETSTCSLSNHDVSVKSYDTDSIINFVCEQPSEQHQGLYWDGALGQVNGGYSPENDALFAGGVIKDLYKQWYGVDVLVTSTGRPMRLVMAVHKPWDNAAWNGQAMIFGDGVTEFYPLTSLGIAAHEISHGFTEQNANLYYRYQSGAMNEAFSDMAAKAAEVFAYGQVRDWGIGSEITKPPLVALRFMDHPSKDCVGESGACSIDNAKQYTDALNVHYSSGVYNRAFYLLANASGWDVKKAFGVMVYANQNYWTSNSTFEEGACGVLAATQELGEDGEAVKAAFQKVGVSTASCGG